VITAVVDTNVLASGFAGILIPTSTPGEVIRQWRRGTYTLVVSQHILAELRRTLRNPYFSSRLTSRQITEAVALLRLRAALTPLTAHVSGVATHPEDDAVLATAVSGRVDYLVTGDRPLQAVGTYAGVTILPPLAFLTELRQLP
jgi:uncharacterized protein